MTHHRCSRCKQESYPRYKRKSGGLLCEDCISRLGGRGGGGWLGGMFSRFWRGMITFVCRVIGRPLSKKQTIKEQNQIVHHQLKVMEAKARRMPRNLQQTMMQKH